MGKYTSHRIIDGKTRKVIVDENGKIVNLNPSKEEYKGLEKEICVKRQKYTKDQLLKFMVQFFKDTGRVPMNQDFVDNPKYPGFNVYKKYFGSWNEAMRISGLLDKRKITRTGNTYTDEDLLEYLKNFEKENGRSPKADDFNNSSIYPGFTTYQRRFGRWNNALDAAGLCVNCLRGVEDEELLGRLMQFCEETGRLPVEKDFENDHKYPSLSTYYRHFGNWSNALKLVGLDVDSMIMKGIVETTQQRGRLGESIVRDHFERNPIDSSGINCGSPHDGICPNGKIYEVKSSKFYIYEKRWKFIIENEYKEDIEIYYLLAFNEDYTVLEYVWRIPGEMVEKGHFGVAISPSDAEFTTQNMEEYNIIDKFRNARIARD